MQWSWIGLLSVVAFAAAFPSAVCGQTPRADVRVHPGHTVGLDDSPPYAWVGGGAVTVAAGPHARLGLEASFARMFGPYSESRFPEGGPSGHPQECQADAAKSIRHDQTGARAGRTSPSGQILLAAPLRDLLVLEELTMVRWEQTETIALAKFKATCLAELQRVRTTGQTVRMTRGDRSRPRSAACGMNRLRGEPSGLICTARPNAPVISSVEHM